MAQETIKINDTLKKTENWYNLVTEKGKISINVASNPKTIQAINDGLAEVVVNLNPSKDDPTKFFAFDVSEKKPYTPSSNPKPFHKNSGGGKDWDKVDKRIIAQNSLGNAIEFCKCEGLHFDTLKVIAVANDFYNYVMMKGEQEQ